MVDAIITIVCIILFFFMCLFYKIGYEEGSKYNKSYKAFLQERLKELNKEVEDLKKKNDKTS